MLTTRQARFGKPDLDARTIPVVLATDAPVERQGFVEVLDVTSQGVDLSRGDLPLIESHDASRVNIGVVTGIRVEAGKLRGLAVFGKSARADELLQDVLDGIVTGVSIGYRLADDGEPMTLRDGRPARKFRFMPFEVSVVAVPADVNAGFFRSTPLTLKPESSPMTTTTETRNHAAEIAAIARSLPDGQSLAISAIERGLTAEQFQREALEKLMSKPIPTAGTATRAPDVADVSAQMTRLRTAEDFRSYYATKAQRDERGFTFTDFMRGAARMKTSDAAQRALSVAVDSAGGYAVPAVHMGSILSALAPASSLMNAGASIVPLPEQGKTFSFAAVDTLPTAAWREENAQVAESAPTFRNVILTPRSLSFYIKVSRELLADGVNVEAALVQAIAQAFAKEIDRAGLRGSGTAPEPRGLLNTAGIHSVTNGANGAALASYANLFTGMQSILAADAPMPTAAIMAPRSQVKLAGLTDTTGQPLRVPPMLENLAMVTSSQIPVNLTVGTSTDCSEIYLGDFTQLVFGMREQLSIQVLEERFADYGQIGFMCHARLDVAVLYPKAFALVTGVR